MASLLAHELTHSVVAPRWPRPPRDNLIVELLPRLQAGRDRRALVLDDGRLVGIVALSDIPRALSWLTAATRPRI
jgi:hypothetical protein